MHTSGEQAHVAGSSQASWRKSTWSAHNGNCVEFAELPSGHCGVRDSRDAAGPALVFSRQEWSAFVAAAAAGEFDPG
ncbi:MAG: DUF397 domain-containing protein [Actinobacteria bacterium]|nr:DUF397 domain-containing protein [Actinomycetota bacterium]